MTDWWTLQKASAETGLPVKFFRGLMERGIMRENTHYRKLPVGPKGRIVLRVKEVNRCLAEL